MTNIPLQHFFTMNNIIQTFCWGSHTAISEFLGINNQDNQPQAEIWMGATPQGCSTIRIKDKTHYLSDFINQDKNAILSKKTTTKFGELPYLFKVLAARESLSIQVHPSKKQAQLGFKKEELTGIPITAKNRNYKDSNHKPELVYALTSYQALNGFKAFSEIISIFQKINITVIQDIVEAFSIQVNSAGLKTFFSAILSLSDNVKKTALEMLIEYARNHKNNPLFTLILDLSIQHPTDIGLFSPLILNVITLKPGDAMFLYACTPHAYIKGMGLEVMANSDNVLRAGLTAKHIDVTELVSCTNFIETPFDKLLFTPEQKTGYWDYCTPVDDFKFSLFEQTDDITIQMHSAEIILSLDANATITHQSGETITVSKGESLFIPAYTDKYQLTSHGRIARVYN
jgi:mannose-6-phosphate isomerase